MFFNTVNCIYTIVKSFNNSGAKTQNYAVRIINVIHKMRHILFIILLFGSLSICYASTVQKPNDSQGLSPELIAAIFGAISAGGITAIIKFVEWFFGRRMLMNNLKKGLYFEIDNHKIIDLDKDSDNQPNFALSSFNDIFYHSNLSDITKVLGEDLVQQLIFYYSHLKLAFDLQNELFEVNEKIDVNKLTRSISGDNKLYEKTKSLKESIRIILATAQYIRINLLTELKKLFKEDPTKLTFIDVLPEHKDWFDSIQKRNV